jgi:CRP/FNR family transcriptional regulator, cyclic AMP receptor protein
MADTTKAATSMPANSSMMAFFRTGTPKRYNKGEIILQSSTVPEGVYFVDKGQVKAYSIKDDGEEAIHIMYAHGDAFPLVWAFRGLRRGLFYEALGSVLVWVASVESFIAFTHSSLEASNSMVDQLVEQLNVYTHRVNNFGYKRAGDRIVYRLLVMAMRFGTKCPDGIIIDVNLTQQDIARAINVARESVAREFDHLKKKGIISYDKRRIIIKDLVRLSDELGESASGTLSVVQEAMQQNQ